jgi:hypothetical protein
MLADGGGMFGVFLCHVGRELRAAGSATCFDFGGFFGRETRDLFGVNLFRFRGFFLVLFLAFEFGVTDESIRLGYLRSLLVFGFDEIGSECRDLIFAQFRFRVRLSGVSIGLLRRCFGGSLLSSLWSFRCRGCFAFSGISQQPAGKSAGEAARHSDIAGRRRNWCPCIASRVFLSFHLLAANLALDERRLRSRSRGLVAIFRQRFAGKQNLFLHSAIRTGRPGIA